MVTRIRILAASLALALLLPCGSRATTAFPNILPEYRTPELHRQGLSFSGRLSFDRSYRHADGRYDIDVAYDKRSSWEHYWANLSGGWNLYLDRPEFEAEYKAWTRLNRNYTHSSARAHNMDGESKGREHFVDSDFLGSLRHRHHGDSGFYLGYGFELDYRRDNDWSLNESGTSYWDWDISVPVAEGHTVDRSRLSEFLAAELPLGVGYGRVYDVTDARQAVYILADLADLGCLSRIPRREEILDFAQLITERNNRRVFDSREKTIATIEALDGWLRERELLATDRAAYFTALYDNWAHAAEVPRRSGLRIGLDLVPAYAGGEWDREIRVDLELGESDWESRDYEKSEDWNLGLRLAALWARPLTLRWQWDTEGGFIIFYARGERYEERFYAASDAAQDQQESWDGDTNGYSLTAFMSSALTFHRDTRNSFTIGARIAMQREEITRDAVRIEFDEAENVKEDGFAQVYRAGLSAGWTHYLTMKHRLILSARGTWSRWETHVFDWTSGERRNDRRTLDSDFGVHFYYSYILF